MKQSAIAIKCDKILTPNKVIHKGILLTEGCKIRAVCKEAGIVLPPGAKIFDLPELIALPGFIDVHIHGWGRYAFNACHAELLEKVSLLLPLFGVTTYLPAISDIPKEDMLAQLKKIADFMSSQKRGARAAGFHMEGPFLNPHKKGAMAANILLEPDMYFLENCIVAGGGYMKMMTLSPELRGALDLIKFLKARGIIPCMGHSQADYPRALAAIRNGAKHAIHAFNAMGPFHHRMPGLVGAVLTSDMVTAEIIPDGAHLHPAAVKLLYRAKGRAAVITVSDAHPMAGMKSGEYVDRIGRKVTVSENAVRLEDGNLAGGATPMNILVKNLAEFAEISLMEALFSATINPAKLLGIDKEVGSLEPGKDADVTVVDSALNVKLTMVKGEVLVDTHKR